jgi:hypothetical protein
MKSCMLCVLCQCIIQHKQEIIRKDLEIEKLKEESRLKHKSIQEMKLRKYIQSILVSLNIQL